MKSSIERRMEIVRVVNQDGRSRVDSLATKYGVSSVTIRSDLVFLEKKRLIIRTHGAAISNTGIIPELTVHEKLHQNTEIKSLVGLAAAKLIESGDTIILDSGTTIREVSRSIRGIDNLVVMTNSLDVAIDLTPEAKIELLMTGGALRKNSLSLFGPQAENSLKNYRFDKVFLGVDGFDIKAGITTHNEYEANLNRLMCEISDQVIVVADSTKFGKRSCHIIREFGNIDILITDSGIPEDYLKSLREMKVEVIVTGNGSVTS
ncbi:transcriptional repressor AgaR [Photobacterium indicum]|uniref:transcriptional repressor AgaR n=1 Tax=Photobacterium indicum TaxID=81447 RepID=UPI003D0F93A7